MTKARQNQGWKKIIRGAALGAGLLTLIGISNAKSQDLIGSEDCPVTSSTQSIQNIPSDYDSMSSERAIQAKENIYSMEEVKEIKEKTKKTYADLDIGYVEERNVLQDQQYSIIGLKIENKVSNDIKIHNKTNGYLTLDDMLVKAFGSSSIDQIITNSDVLQAKADLIAGVKQSIKPWLSVSAGAGYNIEYTNTSTDLSGIPNMDVSNIDEESLSGLMANVIVDVLGFNIDGKYKLKNGQSKNSTSVSSSLYNINQNLVERANLQGNEYSVDIKKEIETKGNKIVELKLNLFEQNYMQKDKINELVMYDSRTQGGSIKITKDISNNFSGYVEFGKAVTTERLNDFKTEQTISNGGFKIKF